MRFDLEIFKFSIDEHTGVDSKDVLPEAHLVERYKPTKATKRSLRLQRRRAFRPLCAFFAYQRLFCGLFDPPQLAVNFAKLLGIVLEAQRRPKRTHNSHCFVSFSNRRLWIFFSLRDRPNAIDIV